MTILLLFYRYYTHKSSRCHSRIYTRPSSSCKGNTRLYDTSRISNKHITHSVTNGNRFSRICIV